MGLVQLGFELTTDTEHDDQGSLNLHADPVYVPMRSGDGWSELSPYGGAFVPVGQICRRCGAPAVFWGIDWEPRFCCLYCHEIFSASDYETVVVHGLRGEIDRVRLEWERRYPQYAPRSGIPIVFRRGPIANHPPTVECYGRYEISELQSL